MIVTIGAPDPTASVNSTADGDRVGERMVPTEDDKITKQKQMYSMSFGVLGECLEE